MLAEKPTHAAVYRTAAESQSPRATADRPPVITIPSAANHSKMAFFEAPRSAIAPSTGESSATIRPAAEFAVPRCKVLSDALVPAPQYCLKNTGTKPAITVVAKAELATS